jgi:cytochrome c-type biogenesis protein CcmH
MRGLIIVLSMFAGSLPAANDPLVFSDPALEVRYNELTTELRCLVCQNQNLADSDAPLAQDLRKEIHGMIEAGSSDEEIKMFLVERYGDFVLYRPAMQGNTLALWLVPLILLAGGGLFVVFTVRVRNRQFTEEQTRNPE